MRRLITIVTGLALLAPAGARSAPSPAEQQIEIAASKSVRIVVHQDGWYAVSGKRLAAAGLSASTPARNLQLYADGRQVPIFVRGTLRGRLSSKGTIEFYGRKRDLLSTEARTYWLVDGTAPGLRVATSKAAASGPGPAARSFPYTSVYDDKQQYYLIANGPAPNFFGPSIRDAPPTNVAVNVVDLDPGSATAALTPVVYGYTLKPHRVKVSVNGTDVTELSFNSTARSAPTVTLPRTLIRNGANTVSLQSMLGELDWSLVDSVRLTYRRLYQVRGNSLAFTLARGRRVTVSGLTSPTVRLVDVTKADQPLVVVPRVRRAGATWSVAIGRAGHRRRFLLMATRRIREPGTVTADRGSQLHALHDGADELIIAPRAFIPALAPLAALRESQGLKVRIVSVADVFDEFDYGIHGPDAVKSFIGWARSQWHPAPRYVLLVGDATTDPRNLLGKNQPDLMPAKFIDTTYDQTVSDDWFGDFDGDGASDVSIGRLPVRTVDEAKTVVSKIVAYDEPGKRNPNGALLVSDSNIGWNFEAATADLGSLIAPKMPVTISKRSDGPTDAAAHARVVSQLDAGPAIVNFFGHGSPGLWTAGGIFESKDAGRLQNGANLSLYVMMTCNNAYFVGPTTTISEALLTDPSGGAVASVASTGFVDAGSQTVLNREFVKLLLQNPTWRLGDVLREAKRSITDPDLRRTEMIVGDPATLIHL